jgi:tagatose-1,6-bisphosphate aldolase
MVIAGRPIWGGVMRHPEARQHDWLLREAVPLFDRLAGIVRARGRSIG